MDNGIPRFQVLINCGGKSGSSTLAETFAHNGFDTFHTHDAAYYATNIDPTYPHSLFDAIDLNMTLYDHIYIIDVYRTPIERKMSSYFQQLDVTTLPPDPSEQFEYVMEQLDKNMLQLEKYYPLVETMRHYGITPFDSFNFEKKYNLYQHKNVSYINLRFQDLDQWSSILSSIFHRPITLHSANVSAHKQYNHLYEQVQKMYRISNTVFIQCLHDPLFYIYNSPAEQLKYINKIQPLLKPSKIVPADFDPTVYLKLNPDIQHSDYDPTAHYELAGYYENRQYKFVNIPPDFNPTVYLQLNPDIQHSDYDPTAHYSI
jgi:hypothetical protein